MIGRMWLLKLRLSIKEYPENMNNLTWKDDWKNVVDEAED